MKSEIIAGNKSECTICATNYNRTSKMPMIICSYGHNICEQCLNDIVKRAPNCPFCR